MKCINKWKLIAACTLCTVLLAGCSAGKPENAYHADSDLSARRTAWDEERADGIAASLCVVSEDVSMTSFAVNTAEAAAIFDVEGTQVLYSKNVHERLYPASTTKILTALVALKYTDPDDEVVVGESVLGFEWDEVVLGLKPGDVITMYDLLHGLLISSGNDAGNAIAEYISGSVEEFALLMTEEAYKLGATNSNFVNPHGLHSDKHYTTVYDLYLIFQEAIQYDLFREIIHSSSYTSSYQSASGQTVRAVWDTTNWYLRQAAQAPDHAVVIGGKTGTTDEAGYCLVLLSQDDEGNDHISIVLKADSRVLLYQNMNELMELMEEDNL